MCSQTLGDDHVDILASFEATISESKLQSLTEDILEIGLDNILDEGLIKEIPIIKTLSAIIGVGANVRDRLFMKKIISFLYGISDIPQEEREEMIRKIDSSEKYSIKVGEKLIYILDSCHDHDSSRNISMLFKAWLKKRISYDHYLALAPKVAQFDKNMFDIFLDSYVPPPHGIGLGKVGVLLGTGLLQIQSNDVQVDVSAAEYEEEPDVDVSGGETYGVFTDIAVSLFEVFADEGHQKASKNKESYMIRQYFK